MFILASYPYVICHSICVAYRQHGQHSKLSRYLIKMPNPSPALTDVVSLLICIKETTDKINLDMQFASITSNIEEMSDSTASHMQKKIQENNKVQVDTEITHLNLKSISNIFFIAKMLQNNKLNLSMK